MHIIFTYNILNGRNGYKFAFNGQMKDDEIYGPGNAYSAQYWEYDARLGRRWNLDPVDQIGISNYACFGDNPIANVDPDGDWVKGAGFWKNLTQSDEKIKAKAFAEKVNGVAFKDKGGWTVNYLSKTIDDYNGIESLPTMHANHFNKKNNPSPSFVQWWNNSDLYFNVKGKFDVGLQAAIKLEAGGAEIGLNANIVSIDLVSGALTQTGDNDESWQINGSFVGKDGYMHVSQGASLSAGGGYSFKQEFDGKINSPGYKNKIKIHTIKAIVGQLKNETNEHGSKTSTVEWTIGGRFALILGIEGSVSFGVKGISK